MIPQLHSKLQKFFSNPELNILMVTLPIMALVTWLVLLYSTPLFVGALLAYLLEGIITRLEKLGCRRDIAISGVLVFAILTLLMTILFAFPRFISQLGDLLKQLPEGASLVDRLATSVNQALPSALKVNPETWAESARDILGGSGENFLNNTLSHAVGFFTVIIYCVLMPLMLFFLLRDKKIIIAWFGKYLPHNRIFRELYENVDEQFGAYIRGKLIEAAIVGFASAFIFILFDLNYAFSLSVLVGLSVIIPFVGAVAVTVPIILVAYFQFGLETIFFKIMIVYLIIQIIDSQILVPILFSGSC